MEAPVSRRSLEIRDLGETCGKGGGDCCARRGAGQARHRWTPQASHPFRWGEDCGGPACGHRHFTPAPAGKGEGRVGELPLPGTCRGCPVF